MTLRIAIVGGGLVGSFASIILPTLPNTSVQTFEKSPSARESGAWISLTESAIEILSKFIPIDEISNITGKPGFNQNYIYKDIDEEVVSFKKSNKITKYGNSKTHRSALLNLLLRYVQQDVIQYGSNIGKIKFTEENVRLEVNKELKEFDLVVAADGIYSNIRSQIYPNIAIKSREKIAYRNIFPYNLVEDLPSYISATKDLDGTLAYVHNGEIVFLAPLGLNTFGLVIIIPEPPEIINSLKWDKTIDRIHFDRLKKRFIEWPQVVIDLINISPYFNAFPLETAPWLENLNHLDKLAFVGDAAHPTSGAYGSGAAFGFGDVYALYRSLKDVSNNEWKRKRSELNHREYEQDLEKYDLKKALFLFDETRRYFLKDVYNQINRDLENIKYIRRGSTDDSVRERNLFIQNENNSWISEHIVELEYQRVRAKNMAALYDESL